MEQIQNKAIETYTQNLEYFKKTDEPLYNKIVSLSDQIQNNQYKERYHLEYIKEDQEFDIFDELTQSYLYNRTPNNFIKEAVQNSNLDKLNSVDLLHPEIYNTKQPYYIDPKDNTLTRSTMMYHNDIFEFIKIFKKSTVYKKKKFKYLEKFIFIGSLLGTHIAPIAKKLQLNFYLIYEYNLEIFRLSLFTTNYAVLSQNALILFSINEDKQKVEWILNQFFNYAIRSNYILKYYCTNYNIHDYFDRILAVSSQRTPVAFSYTKMFEGFLKPNFKNIIQYPVLDTIQTYDFLKNTPVLIIAAGPSFGKNIEWLRKNHKNYFIIAIGAAVKKLCAENILPDMITNVDGDEIIESQFPQEIRNKIKNIPFLSSTATYHKVIEIFNKENVILCEVMGAFKNNSRTVNGYSVGEITLNHAATMGANNIYLLGTDLALDQETGATHIDDHQHSTKHDISDEKKELNSFVKDGTYNLASSTMTIKGNFRDTVITTTTMEKSVMAYNLNMSVLLQNNPSLKVFNLSDGVYLENTIPTHVEDLKPPKNPNTITKEQLLTFLKKNSEVGFNNSEKKLLLQSVDAVELLAQELRRILKLKIKSYEQFTNIRATSLSIINNDLKVHGKFYIDRIFLNYFFMMEPYLGFQFNEKLENEANLVKKVKKAWCEQLLKIANDYKELVYLVTK